MRIQPNAKSQDVLKGMRSNVSAGAGETRMLSGTKKQKQTEEKNRKNGRLFVGNLQKNLQNNPIEKRRAAAKSRALEIIRGAFCSELDTENSIEEINAGADEAKKEMMSCQEELMKVKERRKELDEDEMISAEERKASEKELREAEDFWTKKRDSQKGIVDASEEAVSAIREEARKSAPMVDASDKAEKLLDKEGKEIIGMLFEESREQLDAELDEKIAKAEETKEKKKELEEKLEEQKAERKEKESDGEDSADELLNMSMRYMIRVQNVNEEVQAELRSVAKQMKVSLEDLKGAAVDEEV